MPQIELPPVDPVEAPAKKGLTQQQKIVAKMAKYTARIWWLPPDFMRNDPEFFVGYEASARLSELQADYPTAFESQKDGKYLARRMCFETMDQWLPTMPKDMQAVIKRFYKAD